MNETNINMKAITFQAYGAPSVLTVTEVPRPVVKEDQVLVRILSTAVNSGDIRIRKADPWAVRLIYGLSKPAGLILGAVFSGEIETIGKNVTKFKKGDQVFGITGIKLGAHAEFVCLPEDGAIAIKPAKLSHIEASVIPFGGTTALYLLRKGNVAKGQRVLIYGASGSVGAAAVQIAKSFGAHVTAVCGTANMEMMKSLGADAVIDYKQNDLGSIRKQYDVVFETVDKLPFATAIKLTKEHGTLILGSAGAGDMLRGQWAAMTGTRKVISGIVKLTASDMDFLSSLVQANKLIPVIDRTYPFEQAAEAHTYVERGHKRGNVALVI